MSLIGGVASPLGVSGKKKPELSITRIFYPSGELQVSADLIRPAEGSHPLIVLNHGEIRRMREEVFLDPKRSYLVRKGKEIAEQGYVVLIPHYRGFGDSEGAKPSLWDELDDIEAGMDMVKGQPFVDRERIGMIGGDMGGTLTYLLCQKRKDIKAAVVFDAPVDFLHPKGAFRKNSIITLQIRDDLAQRMGGSVEEKPELYRPLSPYYNMEKMSAPVLIIHADQDDYIPMKQAKLAQEALLENKKPFKFMQVPKTNQHLFITPARRGPAELAWEEVFRFLEKYLK
jgi:dipeptidyl aminopeptidase/acylaminoacyl peptidase